MSLGKKVLIVSAILVFIAITILSLLPPKNGMELPTNDKVGHFLAYAAITFNVCLLATKPKQFLWILPLVICYGVLIEFIQGLVPGRQPSFLDVLANTIGVLIGTIIYYLVGDRTHRILGSN